MLCQYQAYGTENALLVWYSWCLHYFKPHMIKAYREAELHAIDTSSLWKQQPAPTGFVAGWASELAWLFGEEKICLISAWNWCSAQHLDMIVLSHPGPYQAVMHFLLPSFKSHIPHLFTSSIYLKKITKTILVEDIYYNWTNQNRYVHTSEM